MSNPTQEELPLNLPYCPPKERAYLYIMRCESHGENLRKIGFARKDPKHHRAKELGGTSNPDPFIVEYDVLVSGAPEIEKSVHERLAHLRHSSHREFFNVPLQTAIDVINEEAGTNFITDKFEGTNKFAGLPPVFPNPKPHKPSSPPSFPRSKAFQVTPSPPVFPRPKPHSPTSPPVFPRVSS